MNQNYFFDMSNTGNTQGGGNKRYGSHGNPFMKFTVTQLSLGHEIRVFELRIASNFQCMVLAIVNASSSKREASKM